MRLIQALLSSFRLIQAPFSLFRHIWTHLSSWWWRWWWWIVFAEWLTDESCLRLISSRGHCQRFSLSQISDTLRAGFEPAQNPSSDFVERSCAVVISTTPRRFHPSRTEKTSLFWASIQDSSSRTFSWTIGKFENYKIENLHTDVACCCIIATTTKWDQVPLFLE